MLRHPAAIFTELLRQRCTSQPADLRFVHCYNPT